MKVRSLLLSSAFPTPPTAPLSPSTSTMTTDAASSSKNAWVRRLRPILSVNSSKDTSSGSTEDSRRTASP